MPVIGIILEIDVVAEGLFLTPSQVRSFPVEPFVFPVFVECHRFRYAHGKHEKTTFVSLAAASTDDPVAYGGNPPNKWLTGG